MTKSHLLVDILKYLWNLHPPLPLMSQEARRCSTDYSFLFKRSSSTDYGVKRVLDRHTDRAIWVSGTKKISPVHFENHDKLAAGRAPSVATCESKEAKSQPPKLPRTKGLARNSTTWTILSIVPPKQHLQFSGLAPPDRKKISISFPVGRSIRGSRSNHDANTGTVARDNL